MNTETTERPAIEVAPDPSHDPDSATNATVVAYHAAQALALDAGIQAAGRAPTMTEALRLTLHSSLAVCLATVADTLEARRMLAQRIADADVPDLVESCWDLLVEQDIDPEEIAPERVSS